MRDEVEVSIHDGFLRIGRRLYRLLESDPTYQTIRDVYPFSADIASDSCDGKE